MTGGKRAILFFGISIFSLISCQKNNSEWDLINANETYFYTINSEEDELKEASFYQVIESFSSIDVPSSGFLIVGVNRDNIDETPLDWDNLYEKIVNRYASVVLYHFAQADVGLFDGTIFSHRLDKSILPASRDSFLLLETKPTTERIWISSKKQSSNDRIFSFEDTLVNIAYDRISKYARNH